MLKITIPGGELYDEVNERFIYIEPYDLKLEHSLSSLSKWESKWEIPFLGNQERTNEQTIDYIRCMTLTEDVPESIYGRLTSENIEAISAHISAKMSATWFSESETSKVSKKVITAEIIYYWMVQASIPIELENWHINKLLTLIQVCSRENQPEKKLSRAEVMDRNRKLNEARKAQLKTKG